MRRRTRAALLAALTIGLVGGCADAKEPASAEGSPSAAPSPTASPVTPGPPWHDEVAPAPAGDLVGRKGTPCELPITFSAAAQWNVKAAKGTANLGEPHLGNALLLCEIHARPTGSIGFLRVWRVDGVAGGAEAHLKHFLDGYAPKAAGTQYRSGKAGTVDAVEATYRKGDDTVQERAIAISSLYGPIVLSLDGLDRAELLPAYQLAKQSARINRD